MLRRAAVLLAIAALVALAFAALTSDALDAQIGHFDVARIIVGGIALACLLLIVFGTTDTKPPLGPGPPKPLPPTKHEIAMAYTYMVDTYDERSLALFINMMLDPLYYLERISENVSVEEESPQLQVSTSQIFRLSGSTFTQASTTAHSPPASDPPAGLLEPVNHSGNRNIVLVPLVLVEKGTLLDQFIVKDASGRQIPTLSYNQSRGLLAYLVRTLIFDVIPEVNSAEPGGRANWLSTKHRVAANLVTAICAPGPKKKRKQEDQEAIEELLRSVHDLPTTAEWKRRVLRFCDTLVSNYVIVAEAVPPPGGCLVVSYTQAISVESSYSSPANKLRSRFGLRYSTFDIPLNIFALEVEAYHMEMSAAPMQYVYDHHLELMNSKQPLTREEIWTATSKPYLRIHYNSAGPAMHLYIRRQSVDAPNAPSEIGAAEDESAPISRLKSVVEFREIPPGALGAVTVVSVMTAVVIGFFALSHLGHVPKAQGGPLTAGSDIPALVIALPGLASLVIGSWLDLSHLRRSSLATYLGLGASVVLSFASALYFLLDADVTVPGRLGLYVSSGVTISTDAGWLALAGLALTSSLFLVRDVISSSRYYFTQVKERVKRRTE